MRNPQCLIPKHKLGTHLLTHIRVERLNRPCPTLDLSPGPVVWRRDMLPLSQINLIECCNVLEIVLDVCNTVGASLFNLFLRMFGKKKFSLQEALELLESLPSESRDSPTDDYSDEEVPANNLLKFSSDSEEDDE
ncbi:hypothetical protein TNCV_3321501 [Trichonephila clavipes]|nr:hypothetical protein TNCV_3321501 [Trichonephila clavipes]